MVEHLIPLLPLLKEFVVAVEIKTIKNVSKSKSFEIMAKELKNLDMIRAKLEFFAYTAAELEPFMREFQTNRPIAPYLYDRLQLILSSLMGRFMKEQVLNDAKSGSDLVKLDPKKASNCLTNHEVEIGFGARRAVASAVGKKISSDNTINIAVNFRREAKEIMQVIVAKIQERSPLKYSKVKALSSLCPSLIWSDAKESVKRFKSLCNALLDTNRITTTVADKALRQWETLVQSGDCKSRVKDFGNLANADPNKRLDIFFRGLLNQKDEFQELYTIVKMVLILSHGNAEVERGFSVNKLVLKDNMHERSLVSQRIVHQAIPKDGKRYLDIDINKQMIADVRSAWRRREQYLEERRQKKSDEERAAEQNKRKRAEIMELEEKKRKINEESSMVVKSLDQKISNLRKAQ